VRRIRGQVQEERLAVVDRLLDEGGGLAGEDIRLVLLLLASVAPDGAILVEEIVDVAVLGEVGELRLPLVPARRDVIRTARGGIAIEVLADQRRARSGPRRKALNPPSGPVLSITRWLCGYWPVRMEARDGAQSDCVT
jgi:hypothetical protein